MPRPAPLSPPRLAPATSRRFVPGRDDDDDAAKVQMGVGRVRPWASHSRTSTPRIHLRTAACRGRASTSTRPRAGTRALGDMCRGAAAKTWTGRGGRGCAHRLNAAVRSIGVNLRTAPAVASGTEREREGDTRGRRRRRRPFMNVSSPSFVTRRPAPLRRAPPPSRADASAAEPPPACPLTRRGRGCRWPPGRRTGHSRRTSCPRAG